MRKRKTQPHALSEAASETNSAGSACPFDPDWDRSASACQQRADQLLATIPPSVAKKVQGLAVSELGHSISKFDGITGKPKKKMLLDEAVYRLANGHPLGLLYGFVRFRNGATVRFENMRFDSFQPPRSSLPTARGKRPPSEG